MNFKNCTASDLWKYVGGHLSQCGIDSVLVGGAVVSVYTEDAYVSGDLDFIVMNLFVKNLEPAMKQIGFEKQGRHFVHPECKHFFVEFPKGPLGIGEDIYIDPIESREGDKVLKILSPTDCIKDRLASYIHFGSRDTLGQAVMVAKAQPFRLKEVERWCEAEGALEAFQEFKNQFKK